MPELQAILDIIAGLQPPPDMSKLDPAATFAENKLDSLDLMTVYLRIEETFSVKFEDSELGQILSINDLLGELRTKLAK